MSTITETFAHVPECRRDAAVAGFVRANPHQNGIDFWTMMDMILDADAHLPLIGDVEITAATASLLVEQLAGIGIDR